MKCYQPRMEWSTYHYIISIQYKALAGLFFEVLGLELMAFTLSHSTSPIFCEGFFEIWSHGTICLAGFELTSASWVARITGMSHWRPASWSFLLHSKNILKSSESRAKKTCNFIVLHISKYQITYTYVCLN
jgi:hypothetical protein